MSAYAFRWPRPGAGGLLLPALLFLGGIYLLPVLDLIRLSASGATPWEHFARVFATPLYWDSLVRTVAIAATVAALCLVFGYPTALAIHRARGLFRVVLTAAVVLPYFVATLIRTYAWMIVLGRNGPLNKLLLALGLIGEPVQLLFSRVAVLLGITTVLLPLMVLTLQASLSRLDPRLERAAVTSGAGPLAVFWSVTVPLTFPGMAAGALLVFVAALGFFITPTLLGGPSDMMFAMHITQQADFLGSRGFLQALAVLLLAITGGLVAVAGRFLGLQFIWGGEAGPKHGATRSGWIGRAGADAIGWPLLCGLGQLPGWVGTAFVRAVAGFTVATLVLPIGIVATLSFSRASFLTFPPPGWSWRWYAQFFADSNWMTAFGTSVGIAALSAAISVVLGTGAAMGLVRGTFQGKAVLMTVLVSPLIVPPVVLGLSLYGLFLRTGLVGSVPGLAAAHAIGGIPLVVVMAASSLQTVDRRLEQAAAVHGASPLGVFVQVTLPGIAAGLSAAGFFAFLHSFDELVLSLFLTGANLVTLPLKLWGDINYQLNPVLAVVSTLEVAALIPGLLLARRALARRTATL